MVITGLDQLLGGKALISKNMRMGMVTNHTSVTHNVKLGVEQLVKHKYNVSKIFGAEHGFRGNITAGDHVADQLDERTGLPVYSLYGTSKKPSEEMLDGLDAMVFDMQDIGVRFYTYIYTMAFTMEAAAKRGLEYYVLDRPNPITGLKVEGNMLDPAFRSFVGHYPIPIRHGMTVGELAKLFNTEFNIGCSLNIIPMEGWQRSQWYDQTSLSWVMPSPNSTGMDMATLYPGTCLFEGTNVSEGRGTTRPFEMIGAPWINGEEWATELERLSFKGVQFRPTYFTPFTSKYAGQHCQGVQVHVTDREQLKPIKVAVGMIETLKKKYDNHFQWTEPFKERYFIDLLMGTDQFRINIDAGTSVLDWLDEQEETLITFKDIRSKYLIY